MPEKTRATFTPERISEVIWEIPKGTQPGMHVPARFLADDELCSAMMKDGSLQQLVNVTTLPGITRFAMGMPDMHQGYGFPVGGVAGTVLPDGVITPGGIGFDINCGVRLLRTNLRMSEVRPLVEPLVHELSRSVPTGYGKGGRVEVRGGDIDRVMTEGCAYVVREKGLGLEEDLASLESNGCLAGADPSHVSERARQRGADQLGTLGGGNHFLEVQEVDEVYDERAAKALGVERGAVTILVHTGSRGLGHQVCSDHVRSMDAVVARLGFVLPDRQLACAPLSSKEGRAYYGAMAAAANFAWSNRQVLTHRIREAFARIVGTSAEVAVVYDVAHNIAKIERHGLRELCIHRKGATRAFGPSHPETPPKYRGIGQPIFIPGSMGTVSFVLVGTDDSLDVSLGSTCHGAGRAMSRTAAKAAVQGKALRRELESRGIVVRCPSDAELAEEAPTAYKDVERVVDVVAKAGIARKVARLRPAGVLKG
jgi:tRNA-splicing ligase RtcB